MIDNGIQKTLLIVSTMSSGKSTLVNALLGEDILLSKNEACTSTLYHIKVDEKMKGNLNIKYYKDNNTVTQKIVDIKEKETIKKYLCRINQYETIKKIELLGNFKKIKNLSIIDTPGTNNSLDITHMKKTIESIKNEKYNYIIYILNATQLGTNDDKELLQYVKKYTYISKDNIIFVLNKVDELDIEKDDSLEKIYQNCKIYLKSVGFENPILFMTSAYLAKLIQKNENKEYLTKREERKLDSLRNIISDKKFNLDIFNKNKCFNKKSIERKLNGTGISELRDYLTREEE